MIRWTERSGGEPLIRFSLLGDPVPVLIPEFLRFIDCHGENRRLCLSHLCRSGGNLVLVLKAVTEKVLYGFNVAQTLATIAGLVESETAV